MRTRTRFLLIPLFLLVLAPAGCDNGPDTAAGETPPEPGFSPACAGNPMVRILAFDCWARGTAAQPGGIPVDERLLDQAGSWTVDSDAGLGVPATLNLSWDGDPVEGALVTEGAWAAVAFHEEDRDGLSCPAYTVAVGQDHEWLACTGLAPSLNKAALHLSGETLFAAVADDLGGAAVRVHGATWWWQSDFELTRPEGHPEMTPEARTELTVISRLEALAEVPVRIMVARFAASSAAGLAYVNTDPDLRAHALNPDDGFEVISQGNPTPIPLNGDATLIPHPSPFASRLGENPALAALDFQPPGGTIEAAASVTLEGASWHQKVWAIDGRIGYVGGLNVKSTDWDTEQHDPFEARRMKFNSTAEERQAVVERRALTNVGPRKDYGIRVEGPAARDVDAILKGRWDLGRAVGDLFSEHTTPWELLPSAAEPTNGVLLQVQATQPEPFGERSILESTDKAIRNARDLIFIEDQYFRMPVVLDAFAEALAASPDLYVIVVTKPVSLMDGAKKWTVIMDEELRALAGDRYLLLRMEAYAAGFLDDPEQATPHFQAMDIHSKMLIVDDVYLSVGSCNKNNRGLLVEGEMNVAVLDQAFVRSARQRILANTTGLVEEDWNRSGAEVAADLAAIAISNEEIRTEALSTGALPTPPPQGFLYPLAFSPDYLLDVGPDVF